MLRFNGVILVLLLVCARQLYFLCLSFPANNTYCETNAETNCSSYNGRTKKRGRPCTRWRDEVGEDLNMTAIEKIGNVLIT
jgi:hypothetical protein